MTRPDVRTWRVFSVAVLLLVPWIASPTATAAPGQVVFDCAGRSDGNYPHPSDPTKFISCVAQTHAYERNCPSSSLIPPGRLVYAAFEDACDFPDNRAPVPISDGFSDTVGPGPAGESPAMAARAAKATGGVGIGGQITYTVSITSPQPKTAADIHISFTPGLSWVGGVDCTKSPGNSVDCMVYPGQDGIVSSVFTLQAHPLDLGPQTATAHAAHTDPVSTTAIPDKSLTCTVLTGLVVVC